MIINFLHRGLKRLHHNDDRSKLPPELVERLTDILAALDVATGPDDLARPSYRLHPLTGDLRGHWSVTVRANWRITFRIESGNVHDVNFLDYH